MQYWATFWFTMWSVAAGLLVVCLWLWVRRPRTSAPGPTPLPLIGNALDFTNFPVLLSDLRAMHERFGDVFRFYAGPKLFVVVTQPEDIERILTESKERERDECVMDATRLFIGDGLLTNKGSVWKRHRKIFATIYSTKIVDRYLDAFNEGGRFLCDLLATEGNVDLDVYNLLYRSTLHTLLLSSVGIGLDRLEPDVRKQAEIANEIIDGLKNFQATGNAHNSFMASHK